MSRVYTIGDSVLDVYFENEKPIEAKPGGSFLNSSVSLGRLGVQVSFISELGVDRVGDQIKNFLQDNKVDTNHISYFSDTSTNLALAYLDENKNADYSFYKTRKGLESKITFPNSVKEGDVILFGSFLAIKKEFRSSLLDFLKESKKKGALLIYDPNFRTQHLPMLPDVLPYIKENMALADIVKASNEDFDLICNCKDGDSAFKWLNEFSKASLVYTANKFGLFVFNPESHFYSVPAINPVSTVGAGDTVNAAIAYFIVRNGIQQSTLVNMTDVDLEDLAKFAIEFSQEVCMIYDNFLPLSIASKYRL
ncbi:MAG: hypothetical protein JEZ01_14035 [Labilibaculum sp.]|nr:PfkB family carbohydrate kinase [Labilibaculum sp.]MBI9058880.1 hypothetical protein [Labilibaculum sp.]